MTNKNPLEKVEVAQEFDFKIPDAQVDVLLNRLRQIEAENETKINAKKREKNEKELDGVLEELMAAAMERGVVYRKMREAGIAGEELEEFKLVPGLIQEALSKYYEDKDDDEVVEADTPEPIKIEYRRPDNVLKAFPKLLEKAQGFNQQALEAYLSSLESAKTERVGMLSRMEKEEDTVFNDEKGDRITKEHLESTIREIDALIRKYTGEKDAEKIQVDETKREEQLVPMRIRVAKYFADIKKGVDADKRAEINAFIADQKALLEKSGKRKDYDSTAAVLMLGELNKLYMALNSPEPKEEKPVAVKEFAVEASEEVKNYHHTSLKRRIQELRQSEDKEKIKAFVEEYKTKMQYRKNALDNEPVPYFTSPEYVALDRDLINILALEESLEKPAQPVKKIVNKNKKIEAAPVVEQPQEQDEEVTGFEEEWQNRAINPANDAVIGRPEDFLVSQESLDSLNNNGATLEKLDEKLPFTPESEENPEAEQVELQTEFKKITLAELLSDEEIETLKANNPEYRIFVDTMANYNESVRRKLDQEIVRGRLEKVNLLVETLRGSEKNENPVDEAEPSPEHAGEYKLIAVNDPEDEFYVSPENERIMQNSGMIIPIAKAIGEYNKLVESDAKPEEIEEALTEIKKLRAKFRRFKNGPAPKSMFEYKDNEGKKLSVHEVGMNYYEHEDMAGNKSNDPDGKKYSAVDTMYDTNFDEEEMERRIAKDRPLTKAEKKAAAAKAAAKTPSKTKNGFHLKILRSLKQIPHYRKNL